MRASPLVRLVVVGVACATPSQVIIELTADEAVGADAATLRVCIGSEDGTVALDRTAAAELPATVPVSPLDGDTARRFVLLAELRDSSGWLVGRQRIVSGFPSEGRSRVQGHFTAGCGGALACAVGQACVDGACTDVGSAPPIDAWTACADGSACARPGCAPSLTRTWRERSVSPHPSARVGPQLAFHATRRTVVLYGGRLNGEGAGVVPVVASDMWEYDGETWSLLCDDCAPGPRAGHVMVYDSFRDRIVVFGGLDSSSAVWEWDGERWASGEPPGSPGMTTYASATFDELRGRMVLFGGQIEGVGWSDDVYEYDGAAWYRRNPSTRPPARLEQGSAMAFDALEGRSVFYGGREVRSDAWAWDGMEWTQLCDGCSPGGRQSVALVFDRARGQLLLHGGYSDGSTNPGTFAWTGSGWTMIDDAPRGRHSAGVAYDAARDRIVMFGGSGECSLRDPPYLCDETLEYIPAGR